MKTRNRKNPVFKFYSAGVAEEVRGPMRAAADLCGVRQGDIIATTAKALMAGGPRLYEELRRQAAKAPNPAA